jgi:hypothetical protein
MTVTAPDLTVHQHQTAGEFEPLPGEHRRLRFRGCWTPPAGRQTWFASDHVGAFVKTLVDTLLPAGCRRPTERVVLDGDGKITGAADPPAGTALPTYDLDPATPQALADQDTLRDQAGFLLAEVIQAMKIQSACAGLYGEPFDLEDLDEWHHEVLRMPKSHVFTWDEWPAMWHEGLWPQRHWRAPFPLVLVRTLYVPFTGQWPPDGQTRDSIAWVDPSDEIAFVRSLGDAGYPVWDTEHTPA